jgi:ABC-type glycerol-3-phosphate transport system permease component
MKPKVSGTLSGCIVWIIVFGILSACLCPAAMMIAGFTSVSKFAVQTTGPIICPDETTAQPYSYATTTTDEYGNTQPSTAYELHCVDANGVILKKDPVLYAFTWMGVIVVIGLVIAALLAFALAAPAAILISRFLQRGQPPDNAAVIESS